MNADRYIGRTGLASNTDPHVYDTLSEKVVEDCTSLDEAIGRAAEMSEAGDPRCEICGLPMEVNPATGDAFRPSDENDWDGETGNHLSCEAA